MTRRRRLLLALAPAAWVSALPLARAAQRLVLGQTLPLTGPAFPQANRVLAGARAMTERLNAVGGIAGRPLELVTLDDAGDPRRSAEQTRNLAQQHGALAVINTLGEPASLAVAQAALPLALPVVGPMCGALALRQPSMRHVFTLQPDDRRESQALLRQLQAIGIQRLVHLADGHEPAREQALAEVLTAGGLALQRVATTPAALDSALRQVISLDPPALLLSLGPDAVDALSRLPATAQAGLPRVVVCLSGPQLTQTLRLLRDRALGFTSVVPNPEASQLPLVRDFERAIDTLGSPEAISFEGLAAYLCVRLCAEALRRQPARPDGISLAAGLEGLGRFSLGGFVFELAPGRRQASDFVEIGLRTRDGRTRL